MKRTVLIWITVSALLLGALCPVAAQTGTETEDLSWQLVLANPWNPVPADWQSELTDIGSGHRVDKRCAADLIAMLTACREEGLSPIVRSSYRSKATQTALFNSKVAQMKQLGYQGEAAQNKAATIVARPGTSEHQLGLAVDLVDRSYQNLDTRQETTAAQKWLMEHCYEYGFILRYPTDKSDVTGIIYEPWHYRYVGRDHALAIRDAGVCLEEYLDLLAQAEAQEAARAAAYQAAVEAAHQAVEEHFWETLRHIYQVLAGEAELVVEPAGTPAAGEQGPAAPGA